MKQFESIQAILRSTALIGLSAAAAACHGDADLTLDDVNSSESGGASAEAAESEELGEAEQSLWGRSSMPSSCSDPTGTDSVLAALAVSTARELRRWNPVADFFVSAGTLKLTSSGKARCADGACLNTQALLDLQLDAAANVQVRPGVRINPSLLRIRLAWNHGAQAKCVSSWFKNCASPDHQFTLLDMYPGGCDTNYVFQVRASNGTPLSATALTSTLSKLEDNLIWLDDEDNSYIRFQTSGDTITVDPTYGLNEGGSASSGSCSAACTMVSKTNIAGNCCSCNGTKRLARSAWNASTYLCQ